MELLTSIIYITGCALFMFYSWVNDWKRKDDAFRVGVALLLIAIYLKS